MIIKILDDVRIISVSQKMMTEMSPFIDVTLTNIFHEYIEIKKDDNHSSTSDISIEFEQFSHD